MKKKILVAAMIGITTGISLAYIELMKEYNKLLARNNELTESLVRIGDTLKKDMEEREQEKTKEEEKETNEEPKRDDPVERSFISNRSLHFKNSEEAKDFILWWNDRIDNGGRVTYGDICERLGFTILDIAARYDKRIELDNIWFSTTDNSYKIILPVAIIEQYNITNEE